MEVLVKVSARQWLIIIFLDFVIRGLYFILTTLNPLALFIALFLSFVSVASLLVANYSTLLFDLRTRLAALIVVVTANLAFAAVSILVDINFIKAGRQTVCIGDDLKCAWQDGVIAPFGVQLIAEYTAIQIIINLVPLICVLAGRQTKAKADIQ
jgi:hypothetical protein